MRLSYSLSLAILLAVPALQGQVITTVAGTDVVPLADGTPALQGPIEPWGVAQDAAGNVYVADGVRDIVMRVNPDGQYIRLAGNGISGYSGDGGPAVDAALNDPERVVVDPAGNVYFAESGNHRVRRVAPDGTITTYAGTGRPGFSGDNGPATSAALNYPVGLALDAAGNLYISDFLNRRIRRVSPQGVITTVAGNGQPGFSGDGGLATQASINGFGVGASPAGELYIADTYNHRVRMVDAQGVISTIAGTGQAGFSGDQGPAAQATLNLPYDVDIDSQGNVYVEDYLNIRVRRISPGGMMSTVVGSGALGSGGNGLPGTAAPLNFAFAISVTPSGDLLVGDTSGHRVKRLSNATISFVAGNGDQPRSPEGVVATSAYLNGPHGVRFDVNGELLFADTFNHQIRRLRADGTITTVAGTGAVGSGGDGGMATLATLQSPEDVAVDANGNIFIADTSNNRIRRVSTQGVITTIAGNGGFNCDPAANLPFLPKGLAFHPNGDLYFSDICHRIRRISPGGAMSVVAGSGVAGFADGPAAQAQFNSPAGIAFDAAGNLYVADEANHRVRRIDPAGNVTTVAGTGTPGNAGDGGAATAAQLNTPRRVAVTPSGDLLISEFGNHRVRIVSGGQINAFAGNGIEAWAGDGGPAVDASLRRPEGMAVDASGNVFLAEWGNNRIRLILAEAPAVQVTFGTEPAVSLQVKDGERSAFHNVDISAEILGLGFETSADQPWLEVEPERGATPDTIRFRANSAGLSPGEYHGSVIVRAPYGTPLLREVPVVLEVEAGEPAKLVAGSRSLAFSFVEGDEAENRTLAVTNEGAGTVNFHASVVEGDFLSLSESGGSATQTEPANLQVTADPTGLEPGTYTGVIRLEGIGVEDTVDVPVAMNITPTQTNLTTAPAGLFFRAVAGGGTPLPQPVSISNTGEGSMSWDATASTLGGGNWLSLSSNSGTIADPALGSASVEVKVNHAGMSPGEYYGRVDVTAPGNSKQTVSVLLSVLPAGTPLPQEIRPTGLVFVAAQGTNPVAQTFSIANLGTQTLSFNSSRNTLEGGNWFAHLPVGGDLAPNRPAKITVQPDFTGLAPGSYEGSLRFQFSDGTSRSVDILSIVTETPPVSQVEPGAPRSANGCSPRRLNMILTTPDTVDARFGEPANLGVRILDDCGEPVTNLTKNASVTVSYTPAEEPSEPMEHTSGGVWTKTFRARNIRNGTVTAAVTVFVVLPDRSFLANQVEVQIEVTDADGAPVISPGAVANGASFATDKPLAPGTIVTLFGARLAESNRSALGQVPAPTEFNGVQVRLGDRPLPLFYVGERQINAQVPFDIPLNTQQQILVQKGNTLSVPDRFTVGPAQPAMFAVDQNGIGQGAIVNGVTNVLADAAHPVHEGDVVSIYCTGLGLVIPEVPVGELAPLSPLSWTVDTPTVTIGGRNAEVQFSGLAPGFIGLYQINAFVPGGVSGDEVPVVIGIGGQSSSPVTIAVQ